MSLFIKHDNVGTWSEAIYVTGKSYSITVSPEPRNARFQAAAATTT
jgi:hypothetical protein